MIACCALLPKRPDALISTTAAAVRVCDTPAPIDPHVLQALTSIFKSWPKSVVQMISFAAPEAVLESGVYIRAAADMPASMGKGRVAILGEAAHPLR
jgi:hypothetical protein